MCSLQLSACFLASCLASNQGVKAVSSKEELRGGVRVSARYSFGWIGKPNANSLPPPSHVLAIAIHLCRRPFLVFFAVPSLQKSRGCFGQMCSTPTRTPPSIKPSFITPLLWQSSIICNYSYYRVYPIGSNFETQNRVWNSTGMATRLNLKPFKLRT